MDKYKNQNKYIKSEKGKITQKKYQQSEKGKEKSRRYRQSEKGKKFFTIKNWKRRGIITDDYDKVYEEYINTTECKLCNRPFNDSSDRCLDHDHETGLIRNIICRACNTRDYKIKNTQPLNERREYEKSFGGRVDLDNNCLLKIDINLFF